MYMATGIIFAVLLEWLVFCRCWLWVTLPTPTPCCVPRQHLPSLRRTSLALHDSTSTEHKDRYVSEVWHSVLRANLQEFYYWLFYNNYYGVLYRLSTIRFHRYQVNNLYTLRLLWGLALRLTTCTTWSSGVTTHLLSSQMLLMPTSLRMGEKLPCTRQSTTTPGSRESLSLWVEHMSLYGMVFSGYAHIINIQVDTA